MEKLFRCKACGYIIDADGIKDRCPACGLPKSVFEPYIDNISVKRKKILDLHLHPIAVHIPQALVMLLIPFIFLGMFFPVEWSRVLLLTAGILAFLLPVFALIAAGAGIIDAHTRFKRLDTPALKSKMIFAAIYFVLSCMISAVVYTFSLEGSAAWWVLILLLLCGGCQYVLGSEGVRLMYARISGD